MLFGSLNEAYQYLVSNGVPPEKARKVFELDDRPSPCGSFTWIEVSKDKEHYIVRIIGDDYCWCGNSTCILDYIEI